MRVIFTQRVDGGGLIRPSIFHDQVGKNEKKDVVKLAMLVFAAHPKTHKNASLSQKISLRRKFRKLGRL